jgi:hypothetical protein
LKSAIGVSSPFLLYLFIDCLLKAWVRVHALTVQLLPEVRRVHSLPVL